MAKVLKGVGGVLKMSVVSVTPDYDSVYVVTGSDLDPDDLITLPASETYDSAELKVYRNGQFMEVGQDYDYEGAGPSRTQIKTLVPLYIGERIRFVKDAIA